MGSEGAGCFAGDLSDMPIEARRAAIRLKWGRPVMALADDDSFRTLLEHRASVERSLNDDLMTLYVDEENCVAWATRPEGLEEASLLSASCLSRNDVATFTCLADFVLERRQLGHLSAAGWFITRDELFARYVASSRTYSSDTRGERVAKGFDSALARAISNHWARRVSDDRIQALPLVAALVDMGFAETLAVACVGVASERKGDDGQPA